MHDAPPTKKIGSFDPHGLLGAFQEALGGGGEVFQAQHSGAQLAISTGDQGKRHNAGMAFLFSTEELL